MAVTHICILCAELALSLWCWHSFTVRPISGTVEASADPAAGRWVGQGPPDAQNIKQCIKQFGLFRAVLRSADRRQYSIVDISRCLLIIKVL